ncbi:MAG: hypothetical protein GY939_06475, partial [Actinomycetia bacterium]|nr:hypothetical protein [Actinomycetes bacterium]
RFSGPLGKVDTTWKPEVTGSGVWGIDVNPGLGEAYVVGFFTAVNGEANTGYFHTVDTSTGASVSGKIELPRNQPSKQPEIYDVTAGTDSVWVIGEQHIVQTLRASDQQMIAFNHTGLKADGFEHNGSFAGGAYQVGARIGDYVFAGCHCTYSERKGYLNHYSSVSDQRTDHRLLMAYDATTGRLIEEFKPDIHSPRDGTWAIKSDTNGCLWMGGDFHVGGVDNGVSRWLGGFGRVCPTGFDPDLEPPPEPDPSTLVAARSEWRYSDTGADLGTAWRDPGYDDGAWPTGNAEFGFGDGDEATTFTSGFSTYYARTSFEFDGTVPSALGVAIKADDGAVVYLNGVELARENMPDGVITAGTGASGWKGGADESTFVEYIARSDALVVGTNVLAVEVHNVWSGNGDLSLDVVLSASTESPPVPPEPPAGPLVAQGSTWAYIDDATATPTSWQNGIDNGNEGAAPLGFGEGDLQTSLPPGNEAYYFTQVFTVDDADAVGSLTLGLRADDGAIVYINGTEVARVNMPDGPIDWSTRPLTWAVGADEDMKDHAIDAAALVDGPNVVAVEVHNYWPGNADLSFDLRLE